MGISIPTWGHLRRWIAGTRFPSLPCFWTACRLLFTRFIIPAGQHLSISGFLGNNPYPGKDTDNERETSLSQGSAEAGGGGRGRRAVFSDFRRLGGAEKFTLPKLPWPEDALAPLISKETISYHYGKHQAAYVANLNKLIKAVSQGWKHVARGNHQESPRRPTV